MLAGQTLVWAGSIILIISVVTSDPEPLFVLRGQLGGLFGGNGNNERSAHGVGSRYANGAGNYRGGPDQFANAAGFMGGQHGGGAGHSGGGNRYGDNRGTGFSGGNRYGDNHGSGHYGGNRLNDHNGSGHFAGGHPHPNNYGHGGGGGSYGHGEEGGVSYNGSGGGGGGGGVTSGNPGGLKAGLKSLLFGVKGRMKSAYLNMKKALKAMFFRGELGGDTPTNYAGNYGYDRNSPGRRVPEAIEYGRTGSTFLRIGWKPESSYGSWPKWLRFLG